MWVVPPRKTYFQCRIGKPATGDLNVGNLYRFFKSLTIYYQFGNIFL